MPGLRNIRSFAEKFPSVVIALLYTLSWWSSLAIWGGRYWDDWILYGVPVEDQVRHFTEAGSPWLGFIYGYLAVWPPSNSILTFLGPLLALLIWRRVLEAVPGATRLAAVAGTVVASVAPIFIARFAWIQIWSILGLLVFVAAWFGFLKFHWRGGIPLFLASSGGLLLSFALYPAYIALSLGIVVHVFWIQLVTGDRGRLRASVLIALTTAFLSSSWLGARVIFFQPSGDYLGYNEVRLSVPLVFLAALTLGIAVVFAISVIGLPKSHSSRTQPSTQVFFSLLMLCLTLGPYIGTGSYPPFEEWKTRYEINLLLVLSLFAVAAMPAVKVFSDHVVTRILASSIVVVLIFVSNLHGLQALADWKKQESLILSLGEVRTQLTGALVVFVDGTRDQNLFGRQYRFYEWSSILAEATGSRNSFGIEAESEIDAARAVEDHTREGHPGVSYVYNFPWRQYAFSGEWRIVRIESSAHPCIALWVRDRCVRVEIVSMNPNF